MRANTCWRTTYAKHLQAPLRRRATCLWAERVRSMLLRDYRRDRFSATAGASSTSFRKLSPSFRARICHFGAGTEAQSCPVQLEIKIELHCPKTIFETHCKKRIYMSTCHVLHELHIPRSWRQQYQSSYCEGHCNIRDIHYYTNSTVAHSVGIWTVYRPNDKCDRCRARDDDCGISIDRPHSVTCMCRSDRHCQYLRLFCDRAYYVPILCRSDAPWRCCIRSCRTLRVHSPSAERYSGPFHTAQRVRLLLLECLRCGCSWLRRNMLHKDHVDAGV